MMSHNALPVAVLADYGIAWKVLESQNTSKLDSRQCEWLVEWSKCLGDVLCVWASSSLDVSSETVSSITVKY